MGNTSKTLKRISQQLSDITSSIKELKNNKSLVDEWRDEDETCEQLGVSKRTMKRRRDRGEISHAKIGSKIYYRTSDIEAFLMHHYIKSTRSEGREEK